MVLTDSIADITTTSTTNLVTDTAAVTTNDVQEEHNNGSINDHEQSNGVIATSTIPLVEVQIENVSYAPIVSTVGSTGSSSKKKQQQQLVKKSILKNITTKLVPYQLTAWMGPSGSGKTSLLSVIAGLVGNSNNSNNKSNSKRKQNTSDQNVITGTIKVNGEIGIIPKQYIGIVYQDDLLLSNLTVEENLYYVARLKTSMTTSNEGVRNNVVATMKELGIYHIRNQLVGDPYSITNHNRGISGGERKRVAVGIELVVQPSILLLDEITSGLDSTTAYNLIGTLHDLAHNKGHTIVTIIHQPRTTIFNMFDHLLLLSQGSMIYDGHPKHVRSYFEQYYGELPPETGIADWMMDIVTTVEKNGQFSAAMDSNENENGKNNVLAEQWTTYSKHIEASSTANNNENSISHDSQQQQQQLQTRYKREMSSLYELRAGGIRPKYNTNFVTQLYILSTRISKQQRGERITRSTILLQLLYTFFTALFWWRIPDYTSRIFERNSLFFFILIAQANSIVITAVTVFQRERILLSRERAKKMYTVSSYFIAKTLSDVTNNVLLPVVFAMIVYWTANFRPSFVAYLKYTFVFYWIFSTAQSMGLFISVAIPNRNLSLLFAPPITLFFAILGGFYIPLNNLHPGILWATYLSFARYGYSALIINEYEGRTIPCSTGNEIGFIDGSSDNNNEECPLPGETVINSFGIYGINESFWFNVGMMIVLQFTFRIGAYFCLRRSK